MRADTSKPSSKCSKETDFDKKSLPAHEDMDLLELAKLTSEKDDMVGLLPLPLPCRPIRPNSSSARLRSRHAGRLQVWREACKFILLVNGLNSGSVNYSK